MGSSRNILISCGRDLGFSMKDGIVTLSVRNDDFLNMRSDVQKIGSDMRKVMDTRL